MFSDAPFDQLQQEDISQFTQPDGYTHYSNWEAQPDASGWEHYNAFVAQNDAGVYPSPPESQGHSNAGGYINEFSSPEMVAPLTPAEYLRPTANLNLELKQDKVQAFHSANAISAANFCPAQRSNEADTIVSSTDGVFFYVHAKVLRNASPNAFSAYLPAHAGTGTETVVLQLPDTALTLNIILHTIYGSSCCHRHHRDHTRSSRPALNDLVTAVDRMPHYKLLPSTIILPRTLLHKHLLSYAPHHPIVVYALAGFHRLDTLAQLTSSHLLAYPLSNIDDTLASRMGPVYLKRLFLLHAMRMEALKDILLQAPPPHPPTEECPLVQQQKLMRAWALASAHLVWEARPDISAFLIQSSFNSLIANLECKECGASAENRIREIMFRWSAVKCTI